MRQTEILPNHIQNNIVIDELIKYNNIYVKVVKADSPVQDTLLPEQYNIMKSNYESRLITRGYSNINLLPIQMSHFLWYTR